MDQITALLRRTMPFQTVPDALLQAVAKLAKLTSYARGDVIYSTGDAADDIHVVSSGSVSHVMANGPDGEPNEKTMQDGDVFGWAAVLEGQRSRMAKTVCLERTETIRINGAALMDIIGKSPATGDVVMSRFATMITREFAAPASTAARVWHPAVPGTGTRAGKPVEQRAPGVATGWALLSFRMSLWLKSPKPYLMLTGFAIFLGLWYLTVQVWRLPRFADLPGLTTVIRELFSTNPTYGLSLYTPEYYQHIGVSVRRVAKPSSWQPHSACLWACSWAGPKSFVNTYSPCSRPCARFRSWLGCRWRS